MNDSPFSKNKKILPSPIMRSSLLSPNKDRINDCYDSFAFQDRITNNKFQYKQARENGQKNLNFGDWMGKFNIPSKQLKNSVDVYKFTKKFEINCIRSAYFKQHISNTNWSDQTSPQHETSKVSTSDKYLGRKALFQINKQEIRRVLENNTRVSPQIIQLNKLGKINQSASSLKKSKILPKKWVQVQNTTLKDSDFLTTAQQDVQRRLTENMINHMNCQIKANGQYLLNMPLKKKKNLLIRKQLRKQRQYTKLLTPKYSYSDVASCTFSALLAQEPKSLIQQSQINNFRSQEIQLLEKVKRGYISQVIFELNKNPSLSSSKDDLGNNIFHIAAKQGNREMIIMLLKAISNKKSISLLADRNNLKRTPINKAMSLGSMQIVALFEEFKKSCKTIN